jgi:acetylglutamate kinase
MTALDDFAGRTFVMRVDRSTIDGSGSTIIDDLAFLAARRVHPIVVAPDATVAKSWVRTLNRRSNVAVGLTGADAALLPATPGRMGTIQTHILQTLTSAGYVPVIEPTAIGIAGEEIAIEPDDVAGAIAAATTASRILFFHESGGVVDSDTELVIEELTPAEALALADEPGFDAELRGAMRAAAYGVRAGVGAAHILNGSVAHATIVEFLTDHHLGTRVAGTVFLA